MTRLRSCEGCARHVRLDEQTCPFCQRSLSAAPAPAPLKLPTGLSRAQRLAIAAAIAGGAACADTTEGGGTPVPIYGAPLPAAGTVGQAGSSGKAGSAAAGSAATGAAASGGQVAVPVYGAPLAGNPSQVKDAGQDAGDDEQDAGPSDAGPRKDAGQMAVPLYGAAPVPIYGAPIPKR